MIKRYFYIFSATLFILFTPTTGVKAEIGDHKLEELARRTNSPPASGFNYQAVIRDNGGDVLASTSVTLRFTLSNSGGDVWEETHNSSTDTYGLVSVVIGEGSKTGGSATTFDDIDWSTTISVQVEVDAGDGFVDLGTNELQSVPYANYANNGLSNAQSTKLDGLDANAEENVQSDWNETDNTSDAFVLNKPTIPADVGDLTDTGGLLGGSFSGSYNDLTDVPTNIDTDNTDDVVLTTAAPAGQITGDFQSGLFIATDGVTSTEILDGTITNDDVNDISYLKILDAPNLDIDDTDDFSGSWNDLTDVPADIADGDNDTTYGAGSGLTLTGTTFSVDNSVATTADLVFGNTSNVVSGGDANDDFVFGSAQLADAGNATEDSRFFFDKSKGAFRAGVANAGEWDNVNVGTWSTVSGGINNVASDLSATVGGGYGNSATGNSSTVSGGYQNSAGNNATVGGGSDNDASGSSATISGGATNTANYSFATVGGGTQNSASNQRTTIGGGFGNSAGTFGSGGTVAGGASNNASGGYASVGGGVGNTASGTNSTISGGAANQASAPNSSIIGGYYIEASGTSSVAGGHRVAAQSFGEFAVGVHSSNASSPTAGSFVATDRIFTIGNGTSTAARSNAMVVLKNGDTDINGNLVANSLGVDGQFTLPSADGTSGQILSTDGVGNVSWESPVTVVRSSATSITIPDNIREYVFSHDGTSSFTVNMPSSSTIGDKISFALNVYSNSPRISFATTTARILGLTADNWLIDLDSTNASVTLIYDGVTWVVASGIISSNF